MKEFIELLKREAELLDETKRLAEEQRDILARERGGAAAGKISEQLEPYLLALSAAEIKQTRLLEKYKEKTVAGLLEKQPASAERSEAEQLIKTVGMGLRDLGRITAASKELLRKNREYVGFTINVMNQVAADVTYAPAGENTPEPVRGRKMFDQSI